MNMNKSWDGNTPDWELEPIGTEQKETQESGTGKIPSVADSRVAELAEEVIEPQKAERREAESAQINALREEISKTEKPEQKIGGNKGLGSDEEVESRVDWKQRLRDLFEDITGGDMGEIQRAAIVEKYFREETKKRGILINQHTLEMLNNVVRLSDDEGNFGYGLSTIYGVSIPDKSTESQNTGNIAYYGRKLGERGEFKKPFIEKMSPKERQEYDFELKQLAEVFDIAIKKADAEISSISMDAHENGGYREVRKASIEGGVNIVPRGEHWIIGSVQGGVIRINEGAKLTVTDIVEGGVIAGDKGSHIEILGRQTGGVVKRS